MSKSKTGYSIVYGTAKKAGESRQPRDRRKVPSDFFKRVMPDSEGRAAESIKLRADIENEVAEYDRSKDLHEGNIREMLDRMSAVEINDIRYSIFAPHYDDHMKLHERAIRILLAQVPGLEDVFSKTHNPFIKDEILDLSCGTGTVIKILGDILPPDRVARLRITANDLSDDMKAIARKKLAAFPGHVEFTGQDITELSFEQKFGTAILSQTLHLITDEEVVRQERQSNYRKIDPNRHLEAKLNTIARAWQHLQDDGTLIIIDEWDALLSDRGGPLGAGFAYLFNDSLRQVDYDDLRYVIMNRMHRSRFCLNLNVPIDSEHVMHVMVYRKEPKRHKTKSRFPTDPGSAIYRNDASSDVASAFRTVDRMFIESFNPPDGGKPWVKLLRMDPRKTHISRDGAIPNVESRFNCIILDRVIHSMTTRQRQQMMEMAILAIRPGGSLIIIAEWPAPFGSKNRMEQSEFQSDMKIYAKSLGYGGAVRVPIHQGYGSGMFGYQYWKLY